LSSFAIARQVGSEFHDLIFRTHVVLARSANISGSAKEAVFRFSNPQDRAFSWRDGGTESGNPVTPKCRKNETPGCKSGTMQGTRN
jgi:hypothetical protein